MVEGLTEIRFRPKILYNYIEDFVIYKFDKPVHCKLLPLGKLQLFFQFDDIVHHKTSFTSGWEKRPCSFLAGPYNKGYDLEVCSKTEMFAVLFRPGKYMHFFRDSIADFKNGLFTPDVIWGIQGKELIESIFMANSHEEKCDIIENFLVNLFREFPSSPIESGVQYILNANGVLKIQELAPKTNLSLSQFRKRFKKEVGMSPKEFQKVIRLNAVESFLNNSDHLSLTQLAYEFGYADQSHFIKDYQTLLGTSPGRRVQNTEYALL